MWQTLDSDDSDHPLQRISEALLLVTNRLSYLTVPYCTYLQHVDLVRD